MANYAELSKCIVDGNMGSVKELVNAYLEEGEEPINIINNGLVAGMNEVGILFRAGDKFVPEVLMSARAMSAGMEIVKPLIADHDSVSLGKVVIGTVKGDLHDIGKNLVGMMMEGAGFEVINLGVDIAPEKFVDAVIEHEPDIVALSALLTTTMNTMKGVIESLNEKNLRDKVKVVIGGTPVNQKFADDIGADGFAPDAASATDLCKKLMSA